MSVLYNILMVWKPLYVSGTEAVLYNILMVWKPLYVSGIEAVLYNIVMVWKPLYVSGTEAVLYNILVVWKPLYVNGTEATKRNPMDLVYVPQDILFSSRISIFPFSSCTRIIRRLFCIVLPAVNDIF